MYPKIGPGFEFRRWFCGSVTKHYRRREPKTVLFWREAYRKNVTDWNSILLGETLGSGIYFFSYNVQHFSSNVRLYDKVSGVIE
jgi:hypothetical protein